MNRHFQWAKSNLDGALAMARIVRPFMLHALFAPLLVVAFSNSYAADPAKSIEVRVAVLEPRASLGNRKAVRQLFVLRNVSDGAVAEEIDIALGKVIKKHPQIFLSELSRSQREPDSSLLGNLGPKYVDRLTAHADELKRRAAALRTVRDQALVEMRDKCIFILERE